MSCEVLGPLVNASANFLMNHRNTLIEIKDMLQQRGDTVRASAELTQSLRSKNPSVRVAHSIYGDRRSALSVVPDDAASAIAPSDVMFAFDDELVNSQAYRRVLAQASSKLQPREGQPRPEQSEDNGIRDVIRLTDNLTIDPHGPVRTDCPAESQGLGNLAIAEKLDNSTEICAKCGKYLDGPSLYVRKEQDWIVLHLDCCNICSGCQVRPCLGFYSSCHSWSGFCAIID